MRVLSSYGWQLPRDFGWSNCIAAAAAACLPLVRSQGGAAMATVLRGTHNFNYRGGIIVSQLQLFVYCINRERINNNENNCNSSVNNSGRSVSDNYDDLAGWHRKLYQVAGNWLATTTDAVARDTRKSECLWYFTCESTTSVAAANSQKTEPLGAPSIDDGRWPRLRSSSAEYLLQTVGRASHRVGCQNRCRSSKSKLC